MIRHPIPVVCRQELHWVPESRKVSMPTGERPYRVWTIYGTDSPKLPFTPVHNENAFLEDYVHDWNLRQTLLGWVLNYYSRVAHHDVWILVEFGKSSEEQK